MRIMCVFKSGRILDRTVLGEERVRELSEELPNINYFFHDGATIAPSNSTEKSNHD